MLIFGTDQYDHLLVVTELNESWLLTDPFTIFPFPFPHFRMIILYNSPLYRQTKWVNAYINVPSPYGAIISRPRSMKLTKSLVEHESLFYDPYARKDGKYGAASQIDIPWSTDPQEVSYEDKTNE
jgi:hypothetical protein